MTVTAPAQPAPAVVSWRPGSGPVARGRLHGVYRLLDWFIDVARDRAHLDAILADNGAAAELLYHEARDLHATLKRKAAARRRFFADRDRRRAEGRA